MEGGINTAIASGAAFGNAEDGGAGGQVTGITSLGQGAAQAGFLALLDPSKIQSGLNLNSLALFKSGPGGGGPFAFLGQALDSGITHSFDVGGNGGGEGGGGAEGGGGQAFSSLPAMPDSMHGGQDVPMQMLGAMAPSQTPGQGQSQEVGMGF
jgi:hypothetical protein